MSSLTPLLPPSQHLFVTHKILKSRYKNFFEVFVYPGEIRIWSIDFWERRGLDVKRNTKSMYKN